MLPIDIIHYIISWSSPLIILVMSALMAALSIPFTPEWQHVRRARACLVCSYLILGVVAMGRCMNEINGLEAHNRNVILLSVSSFQALLFTATSLVLIRPSFVHVNRVVRQIVLILCVILGVIGVYNLFPDKHIWALRFFELFYAVINVFYIRVFIREYQKGLREVEENYCDAYAGRLRWIRRFFYSAIMVGFSVYLTVVLSPSRLYFDLVVVVYTIYYVYVVSCLIHYRVSGEFIVKVVSKRKKKEPAQLKDLFLHQVDKNRTPAMNQALQHAQAVQKAKEQKQQIQEMKIQEEVKHEMQETEMRLHEALLQWVADEKYLERDITAVSIAKELGTTLTDLNAYFLQHKNMLFRTWRMNLRIEKAKHLLEEHPEVKIVDLYHHVGFSDKSHFYRQFKEMTGVTPTDYRKKVRPDET